MKAGQAATFATPSSKLLRYLLDPKRAVSERIAKTLVAELFSSPTTPFVADFNGLILNVVGFYLSGDRVFAFFAAVSLVIAVTRLLVIARMHRDGRRGMPVSVGPHVYLGLIACLLYGSLGFAAMWSGIAALQILAAITVIVLVGPICARMFGAPRYALTLIMLSNGPMAAGAVLSGNVWMSILLLQIPGFLLSATTVMNRLQSLTVATLESEQDSHERAQRDSLTGLLNRLGLMTALDRHAGELGQSCIFYLDLDGFKPVNDQYGHQAGDKILQAVAQRLSLVTRSSDLVSRLGGDEFVIVANGLSPLDGEDYAYRLVRSVASEACELDGCKPVKIGASVGFACSPEDGTAGEDLHRKADEALYEAKAAGRGVHRRFKAVALSGAPDRFEPEPAY